MSLFFCLLVMFLAASNAASAPLDAPKVGIGLYYESLCGGCRQFIREQFFPTFQKLGAIMNVTLVPFGNAQEYPDGSQWRFSCQHGPNECVGNIIESCAINILENATSYFPFIHCFEEYISASADPSSIAQYCASQLGIDFTAINKCHTGPQGNALEHEMALKTAALSPRHQYVPWVTLNGKHTDEIENEAMFDLLGLVCKTYQGTKPAACGSNTGRCYKTW